LSEISQSSASRYQLVIQSFVESLGAKAEQLWVDELTPQHIATWRDAFTAIISPATVNLQLKILRSALADAVREQVATANVAALVPRMKVTAQKESRRPFKLPELKKLLAVCDDEWRGMILFGLYTGARLGDVARLTWQQIDLEREELSIVTQKTGRIVLLPLAAPLVAWLTMRAGDDAAAPLFPRAAGIANSKGRTADLSGMFYTQLVAAGLAIERTHKKATRGRDTRRAASTISFHSLRHTATSLLKNAGVSDVITRDIIGHESAAVSRVYTHISTDSKRAAMAKMPDVTK
jgi:integrase